MYLKEYHSSKRQLIQVLPDTSGLEWSEISIVKNQHFV